MDLNRSESRRSAGQPVTAHNLSQLTLALKYEGRRIRVVGTPDNPEFVALDVCDHLGLTNPSAAIADFDDDEKGIRNVYTLGGSQRLATVTEPGLWKLVFKSRKPEAKKFQKWVFKEVLPSIRKYGQYPPPETVEYHPSLKPYTNRVVWVMHARKTLPADHWCVFIEGAEVLIGAEHILGPADLEMKQYDLLDGSIGQHWGAYRDGKPWQGRRQPYAYTFPNPTAGDIRKPWKSCH